MQFPTSIKSRGSIGSKIVKSSPKGKKKEASGDLANFWQHLASELDFENCCCLLLLAVMSRSNVFDVPYRMAWSLRANDFGGQRPSG
eukprot:1155592-Pelagomonas_calceolata.AAC.5